LDGTQTQTRQSNLLHDDESRDQDSWSCNDRSRRLTRGCGRVCEGTGSTAETGATGAGLKPATPLPPSPSSGSALEGQSFKRTWHSISPCIRFKCKKRELKSSECSSANAYAGCTLRTRGGSRPDNRSTSGYSSRRTDRRNSWRYNCTDRIQPQRTRLWANMLGRYMRGMDPLNTFRIGLHPTKQFSIVTLQYSFSASVCFSRNASECVGNRSGSEKSLAESDVSEKPRSR